MHTEACRETEGRSRRMPGQASRVVAASDRYTYARTVAVRRHDRRASVGMMQGGATDENSNAIDFVRHN